MIGEVLQRLASPLLSAPSRRPRHVARVFAVALAFRFCRPAAHTEGAFLHGRGSSKSPVVDLYFRPLHPGAVLAGLAAPALHPLSAWQTARRHMEPWARLHSACQSPQLEGRFPVAAPCPASEPPAQAFKFDMGRVVSPACRPALFNMAPVVLAARFLRPLRVPLAPRFRASAGVFPALLAATVLQVSGVSGLGFALRAQCPPGLRREDRASAVGARPFLRLPSHAPSAAVGPEWRHRLFCPARDSPGCPGLPPGPGGPLAHAGRTPCGPGGRTPSGGP